MSVSTIRHHRHIATARRLQTAGRCGRQPLALPGAQEGLSGEETLSYSSDVYGQAYVSGLFRWVISMLFCLSLDYKTVYSTE